ncbi:hypothetical protein HYT52_00795, partial [Candidatus Woesearchaeota archaeon]|nr:hypothetical protein [Candidatus Woesearchaeota archaeon]
KKEVLAIVLCFFIIGCAEQEIGSVGKPVDEPLDEPVDKRAGVGDLQQVADASEEVRLPEESPQEPIEEIKEQELLREIEQASCETFLFKDLPVNLDKIDHIEPMGSLHGEHVTPIDHQYFHKFGNTAANIELFSPADGVIISMQHMGSFRGDDKNREPMDDYRLVIEHDCGISTIFIHIDKLSERIKKIAPEFGKYKSVHLDVKAGEVLGWFDESSDFNVVDQNFQIQWINPASYDSDQNRGHIQDSFLYFEEPLKQALITKSLRTAKPEGGTLDYDIDGTLQGVWFKEGTKGYEGLARDRYWADHLAIVPDSIDTDHILFSLGTFEGRAQQFGVRGNVPYPRDVTLDSGLVEYELVGFYFYLDGQRWDFKGLTKDLMIKNNDDVRGVALVQLVDKRRLKLELFEGKTGNHVNGFTDKAVFYER